MVQPVKDIVIIGGSHAGLFAAIALSDAGFSVRVFERAGQVLSGTGAGIRVQPLMAEMLARRAGIDLTAHSTRTRFDRHLAPRRSGTGNSVVFEQAEDGQFASWGSLYRALMTRFGSSCYHLGESCVGASDVADKVEVRFASGRQEIADLVVFADGIASSARRRLNPSARMLYAGYVAWRGLVEESRLSAGTRAAIADARIFIVPHLSHVILYPVPGEDGAGALAPPDRRVNAIWYRNVEAGAALTELMTDRQGVHRPTSLPPGSVQDRQLAAFRRAVEAELPPAAAEVFALSQPIVTPIYDVEPDRMVFARQVLIGDAAAATRPHVSASTARAMRAAWGLADALIAARSGGLAAALAAWEGEQTAVARALTARGRMIGRRLQVEGSFEPGSPELTQITMPSGS